MLTSDLRKDVRQEVDDQAGLGQDEGVVRRLGWVGIFRSVIPDGRDL